MANYSAYLHRGKARVHSRDERGALGTKPLIGRSATENPHLVTLAKMACLLLIALVGPAAVVVNSPATSRPASQSEPVGPPVVMRFPGQLVGDIDKTRFGEPSGIVFHPVRKTLFVVGDEGDLCEMKTDGTVIRKEHYPSSSVKMDFEGMTFIPYCFISAL